MFELLIILLVGAFLIYSAFKTSEKKCPPPRIEYRFVPRTLKEELENPVKVSEIFNDMFSDSYNILGRSNGNTTTRSVTKVEKE